MYVVVSRLGHKILSPIRRKFVIFSNNDLYKATFFLSNRLYCEINSNTIIAAGSVVLENTIVESGSVYAGVPAKKVKDINEELINGVIEKVEAGEVVEHNVILDVIRIALRIKTDEFLSYIKL